MTSLIKVKRIRDAVTAYCPTCNLYLDGSWAWDFTKSAALHRSGTGHKVIYLGPKPA